ncbi:MAG TPA: hypothetical protein VH518_21015, partial [Tepidisphaeraceae bacterium]
HRQARNNLHDVVPVRVHHDRVSASATADHLGSREVKPPLPAELAQAASQLTALTMRQQLEDVSSARQFNAPPKNRIVRRHCTEVGQERTGVVALAELLTLDVLFDPVNPIR